MSAQKPLTKTEEEELFRKYQDPGTTIAEKLKIREKIIESNIGFVIKLSKHYAEKSPNYYDDFISSGYEGLVVAFDKFKPDRGFRFLTYAGFWIREKILKCMASFRVVAVPIINQQIQANIDKMVLEGKSRQEILDAFPKSKHKLILRLFDNEFLTYYIEDVTSEVEDLDTEDVFEFHKVDKDRLDEIVENAPFKINSLIMKHFYDGLPITDKQKELVLTYLREQLGTNSP